MRIAICEDEPVFRNSIQKQIEDYYHSLDVVVASFCSGEDLVKHYEEGKKLDGTFGYDVVMLDIEMKQLDGFETAKHIKSFAGKELIIFLTSHTELAMKGYEVEAFRFLAKPVEKEKLVEALEEVKKRMLQEKNVLLRSAGDEYRVAISDIYYMESRRNDVIYYCSLGEEKLSEIQVRDTMGGVEEEFCKEGFFRCHRGYLVQISKIVSYNTKELVLEDGTVLPLSRGKSRLLKEELKKQM